MGVIWLGALILLALFLVPVIILLMLPFRDPDEDRPRFVEDGSGYACLHCGHPAEILVDESGPVPSTPSEPGGWWSSGRLQCTECGAEDYWEGSSP